MTHADILARFADLGLTKIEAAFAAWAAVGRRLDLPETRWTAYQRSSLERLLDKHPDPAYWRALARQGLDAWERCGGAGVLA